ncbi:MAG: hypothetical protein NTX82_06520 [Candidatus Parcubacteria bacterium]|nr:hypothetical protein [Candidatus Parcubacteria bacterium]
MKFEFGKKILKKRSVMLKLFLAMMADWITWQEMTSCMQAELRVYP